MSQEFYVYQLRLDGEEKPFYIGKGTGDRASAHMRPSNLAVDNTFKARVIRKAQSNGVKISVEYVERNLSESEAYELEEMYIWLYGKRANGTGCLANLGDGGKGGSSGHTYVRTREHIEKHRIKMTGRKLSDDHKKKVGDFHRGKPKSEETRKKMSESATGRVMSAESIEKRVTKIRGKPLGDAHKAKLKAASLTNKSNAKFSDVQVIEIRRRYATGTCSMGELSKELNVTKACISMLIRKITYKDVE